MSLPLPKALDNDARDKKDMDALVKYMKRNMLDYMADMKKKEFEGKMKGKNTFHEAGKKLVADFKKQYKG